MRKSLLILLQIVAFAMPLFAERVDEGTARAVAETFMGSKLQRRTSLQQIAYANRGDFSNFYVFGGENCFVIVSAEDCVKPILGYSDENPFGTEAMPENVFGWLKDYDAQIQFAVDSKQVASEAIRSEWNSLKEGRAPATKSTASIAPLIQTKWDQGSPYNDLCPKVGSTRTVTGCVATAMAQILNFWENPSRGIGKHSYSWNNQTLSVNFGATTYDWANMADTYSSSSSQEAKAAVATLMYHCGVSVGMDYGTSGAGGSSASTSAVVDALVNYFNYKPTARYLSRGDDKEAWIQMLIDELSLGRPIQYRGSKSNGGGHSFVCEGYDDDDRFYFNWGWSGYCDGAYSIDVMNPGTGGTGAGSGVYTASQGAIFGIEPNPFVAEPTELEAILEGHNVTLSWNAAEDVSSYNIYRNGNLIGNVQNLTFTDENVYPGEFDYFVRSLSEDDILSLSSNSEHISIAFEQPVVNDLSATVSDDDVQLSWTTPEWVYPEYSTSVLSYGEGVSPGALGYEGKYQVIWAHRYLEADISAMLGMKIYKVAFQANYSGNYQLLFYEGTDPEPSNSVYVQDFATSITGMVEIFLNNPVTIEEKDLWVAILDVDKHDYPAVAIANNSSNNYGNYYSVVGNSSWYRLDGYAWAMKTYVTDGTYAYNLYDGETKLNGETPITGNTYTVSNVADNAAHCYTLKTKYYAGESNPSNMAGVVVGSVSVENLVLAEDDKLTISKDACLSIDGEATSPSVNNLILEDGAQLVHNTFGVMATAKKNITGYGTGNGNWYLIASPMANNVSTNPFVSDYYDLYRYNEPTHYWWNSKTPTSGEGEDGEDHHFDALASGTGYLYANESDQLLSLSGELQPSGQYVSIPLSYTSSLTTLRGFNLVGNPFPCKAMLMGDNIAADFYVMNTDRDELVMSQGIVINPFEGIFVEATSPESAAKFYRWNPDYRGNAVSSYFDITVNEGRSEIDRARVRLGEGNGLGKFSLNENSARIYIPIEKQDYASVFVADRKVLPLNFKPVKNGTYTLTFDLKNVDLAYLHLIDNMTGADTDILAASAYTFDAKTTDYASRFKLVFAEKEGNEETADSDFLYYADGQLFVFGTEEGTVQVVDATGRVVLNESVNGFVSKSMSLKPGVYVARLTCGTVVKTRKFVVK